MTYKTENNVGSPRIHLLNLLKENKVYSEFPQEGFVKVLNNTGYYFSEELLNNNFDLDNSINGKTANEFMKETGYSRPKINNYIEKFLKVVYLTAGYYDFEMFKEYLKNNMKPFVEKRGRHFKKII